jgi:hypothetical protein
MNCLADHRAGVAALPPRADSLHAEDLIEVTKVWRAEQTHSARSASNVDLFGYRESIINLDTEIADRALDLGMTEQQLDGPQIAGATIDQRGLGPTQ